jgi:hypothetical protein
VGQELRPPEPLADEVRPGVIGPHPEHEQQDPAALAAEERERRARGRLGRRVAEAHDEPEQRGVDRAEHRREPCRQALARIQLRECPNRGEDRADGDEDQAAPVELGCDRAVEHDADGKGDAEHRHRRVAGRAEQAEHLDRRERRRDHDQGDDPRPAEHEHDEQRRDEDGGAERALAEHLGGPVRGRRDQRPNRRVRRANSSSAASNASAPKSGQRTSVE